LLSVYANAFSISFSDWAFSWLKRWRKTTVLTAVFFTFFIFRISSSVCIFLIYHFLECCLFSNNFCFLESADKIQFRKNNKHNNLLLLVSAPFCNSHIHKRIDMPLLAFPLFFGV